MESQPCGAAGWPIVERIAGAKRKIASVANDHPGTIASGFSKHWREHRKSIPLPIIGAN